MFNTIAKENVQKYVAIVSIPILDQTKKTAIPPSTRNGKFVYFLHKHIFAIDTTLLMHQPIEFTEPQASPRILILSGVKPPSENVLNC